MSLRRFICISFFLYAAISLTLAGQTQGSNDSFTIAGRVINAVTGEPVRRALVIATGSNSSRRSIGPEAAAAGLEVRQMLTDATGGFRFADLPGRSYQMFATKPQFQPDPASPTGTITLGPSRENVEMRLSPLAAIGGTVLDANGMPLQGINIQAVQAKIRHGRRVLQQSRSVGTNDLGKYRLWNLQPGRYYLKATGRYGTTRSFVGAQAPRVEWNESVASTYYGGARAISSAVPLVIKAGQQQQADFTLTTERTYCIRGSLANAVSGEPVRFDLLNGDEASGNRVSFNDTSGQFVVYDVVPGSYRLRATQGKLEQQKVDEVDVQVGAGDLKDIALSLMPGPKVTAEMRCGTRPTGNGREIPCYAQAVLVDQSGEEHRFQRMGPTDASLSLYVLPGTYTVIVDGGSGYVASVLAGGIPISADMPLVIRQGTPPPALEISINDGGGAVEATLDVEHGSTPITVLLLPDFPSLELPRTTFEHQGTFKFKHVAPGEYTLYASKEADEIEYTNPDIRRGLTTGAKVTIREGTTEKVKIGALAQ